MSHSFEQDAAHSLRLALIEAQYALRATADAPRGRGVLVLVSGIELAGKGDALTQLREWLDPRLLKVSAKLPQTFQGQQPLWQPYVQDLPHRGEMVVMFGNWYGDLLTARLAGKKKRLSRAAFEQQVADLRAFETHLAHEGITVIKCWFDLPWAVLQTRLDQIDPDLQQWQQLHGLDWRKHTDYDDVQAARRLLGDDWVNIDGQHPAQRDVQFGQVVLAALQAKRLPMGRANRRWVDAQIPAALRSPDRQVLQKEPYKARLKTVQARLATLLRQRGDRSLVLVFEGMDAAGKGGAIRRLVAPLDPREYQIHCIAAPEAYEARYSYLWRFWTRLPTAGGLAIFDRSWYGRVLVERIESLIRPNEWQRAYAEINQFEQALTDSGTIVLKFWLAIDADEQWIRFQARAKTPHKQFKLTPDDWRNRERWEDYVQAAADVLAHTQQPHAPWVVVATNDKYSARLAVLEALAQHLSTVLAVSSPRGAVDQP